MNYTLNRKVAELIIEFQNKDYFSDEEMYEIRLNNIKLAKADGVDVSRYTNEFVRNRVYTNTRKRAFYVTAKNILDAITTKDITTLIELIRYDQKLSKALFELFTNIKVPKTNKEILTMLNNL